MRLPIGLGFKLGALVALILATFSASWWLVHHELGVIERLYSRVVNVHDPALDAAYKMHLVHASIGLTVSDALAGTASAPAQRLDAARDDFARNLAVLRNLSDLGARPQLDELATLHAAYLAQAERLIALGLQRDEALAAVVARVTAFKGVLVEALLPTALPPRAAAAMHAALDRMDNAVDAFVRHPNGRSAWRGSRAPRSRLGSSPPTPASGTSTIPIFTALASRSIQGMPPKPPSASGPSRFAAHSSF